MNSLAASYMLGIIVMAGVIGIPVYILLFATIFGGPKVGHVRSVFFGTILLLLAGAVIFSWLGGAILSLVVPG